jgi:type III pantothenate kinase
MGPEFMLPDFLVDVGNTSCKVLAVRSWEESPKGEISRHAHGEIPSELLAPGKLVLMAGSNSYILDLWKEKIQEAGSLTRILDRDHIPIKREMVDPSTVGVDRLLICLGAQVENGPGPHLVVDAGTALTANLVNDSGHFLGGAIGPGMGVMNHALAQKASSLFEVDWVRAPVAFPASTTREAIGLGVHMAAVGFIREAWDKAKMNFSNCKLHLTGRDAPLLHPAFPNANLDPYLLFRGMWSMIVNKDNKYSLKFTIGPGGQ